MDLRSRKWLTMAEAVAYSGRSASTLIRKIRAGLISGHRPPGSHWQVDRESIDACFTPPVSLAAVDILRSLSK